jgi:hypothetical protein
MSNDNEKKDFIDLREDGAKEIPPSQQPPSYTPPPYPPHSSCSRPRRKNRGAAIAITILSLIILVFWVCQARCECDAKKRQPLGRGYGDC